MAIETTAALPDDVVLEVLARVADVAALFRCAAVCKLWRRLIADSSFLRRRWPENATHPSFFAGFFTQQRLHAKEEDEDLPVGVGEVGDPDSPPVLVPVGRSALGPGRRSFLGPRAPAGLLNGATPLAARGGLLLLRLAPHDDHGPVKLAVCQPFAGTCDVLPPLGCEPIRVLCYAILTSQDCGSTNGQRTPPPPEATPDFSTFFRVLAIGLARHNGHLEISLHRFSSTEPSWAISTKRFAELGGHGACTYGQNNAAVCTGGMAHWLCDDWSSIDDSSTHFTIDACSEHGGVSLAKLSLPPPAIKPTLEYFHMADLHGALSLFCLYTEQEEGLGLEIWTRRNATDWYLARVVQLRSRIEGVTYLWPGEKSDTVLINSKAEDMYVAYLDTGAVEKITHEFHGLTTDDAVPMEIDWPSLFMARLGGR